jgi:hypothetical protein
MLSIPDLDALNLVVNESHVEEYPERASWRAFMAARAALPR